LFLDVGDRSGIVWVNGGIKMGAEGWKRRGYIINTMRTDELGFACWV
jgi:hypothetical protein